MGTVYRGLDPKIGRVVALKTINRSAFLDEAQLKSFQERFFREARTIGRLNHPGIVTIYDMGEEGDETFIAMEFVEGRTLEATLTAGERPDPVAAVKVRDVFHEDLSCVQEDFCAMVKKLP